MIGGLSSKKELLVALGNTKGRTRMAVADAALVCAERLLGRDAGTIREETSISP